MIKKSIYKVELINSQTNEVIKSVIGNNSFFKEIEDMGISTEYVNLHFSNTKEDFAPLKIGINNDSSKYIMLHYLKSSTCEGIVIARKYAMIIRDIKKNKDCDWESKLRAIRKYRGISKKRNMKAFKEVISKLAETPYDWKDDMIEFISKNRFYRLTYGKIYRGCDVGSLKWDFNILLKNNSILRYYNHLQNIYQLTLR